MTILTYLSSLLANLVSGGSDDNSNTFKQLIASLVSGGSDDHSNISK